MAANISKKEIRELFVSNLTGTTLTENYLVIIIPLLMQLCHSFFTLNLFQLGFGDFKGNLLFNFLIVLVPSILSITVFSEYLIQVITCIFILCLVLAINSFILSKATKYISEIRVTMHNASSEKGKLGFLFMSQVRGYVLVSVAVCILAVDMNIYPRRWAKTERYGTGLMDIGVGTFAILMGLLWPNKLNRSRFIRQLAVLFMLGTLRLGIIKQINYQEHVSEYGRHWNFFFTLTLIKIVGLFFTRLSRSLSYASISLIIVGIGQHLTLQTFGYEEICLDNNINRDSSILLANKEGIVSLFGYILLWLIGRILSLTLKHKRVWYIIVPIVCICGHLLLDFQYLKVSRRSANMAYVMWTTVCFGLKLLLMFCGDVLVNCLEDRANYVNKLECPDVFSVVNRRGLLHFLLANILTGLVNITMEPQQMTPVSSVATLVLYTALPVAIIHWLDLYYRSNGHKND